MKMNTARVAHAVVRACKAAGVIPPPTLVEAIEAALCKAPRPASKPPALTAQKFERLYFDACMNATAAYGPRWYLDCPGVLWGEVPKRLRYRFIVGVFERRRHYGPRDRKIPPAQFWPGGVIPEEIKIFEKPVLNQHSAAFRRMVEINLEGVEREIAVRSGEQGSTYMDRLRALRRELREELARFPPRNAVDNG